VHLKTSPAWTVELTATTRHRVAALHVCSRPPPDAHVVVDSAQSLEGRGARRIAFRGGTVGSSGPTVRVGRYPFPFLCALRTAPFSPSRGNIQERRARRRRGGRLDTTLKPPRVDRFAGGDLVRERAQRRRMTSMRDARAPVSTRFAPGGAGGGGSQALGTVPADPAAGPTSPQHLFYTALYHALPVPQRPFQRRGRRLPGLTTASSTGPPAHVRTTTSRRGEQLPRRQEPAARRWLFPGRAYREHPAPSSSMESNLQGVSCPRFGEKTSTRLTSFGYPANPDDRGRPVHRGGSAPVWKRGCPCTRRFPSDLVRRRPAAVPQPWATCRAM